MSSKVQYDLELSKDLEEMIKKISASMTNGDEKELIRKAILLMDTVDQAQANGESLALINQNNDVTARVILN
ncbi:hypothetical protein H0A36_26135 [Endozoicomonas sp. SM1973]|uniref:Uncharacterized protein n=1 Tax=Spartinivicinus marinus TaxID=2994442 RepID=A0A853IHI4_9GAMM|nr:MULTISPECIES: hypothetical protein [Spartinivicinus]NYZ69501.1 hypothetical protein [Spartinivicinus marinus]